MYPIRVAIAVAATYARIGRLSGVFSVIPSSLLTAVFASQLKATTSSRMSSLRITMRRPSATMPPLPSCGESSMEKITRYSPNSIRAKTMRKTASAAARTKGESTRLLHSHDLVAQAEAHQLLTFRLRFP